MDLRLSLSRIVGILKSCFLRNKILIKVVTIVFFLILLLSIVVTSLAFNLAPNLSSIFESFAQSERSYVALPPPFTEELFSYILLNNIGHFWNPLKSLVWVPLLGAFVLGLELFLNASIIGAVIVFAARTHGILYPILGLTPHGLFEIPAFVLEFSSIIRWQITIIETLLAKITGEPVRGEIVKRGLKDALLLALISVLLFVIAAAIETYITPGVLGIE